MKHGITIREKKSNKLVEFIECPVGNPALRILSGVRINLNHEEYMTEEGFVTEEEVRDDEEIK